MSLTKHPEGSFRELWGISFPLMISSLSMMSMLFVDRILLAKYSLAAFAAAVGAGTLGWAFLFGWMILASIDEVFVAQYNGAGRKEKFGEPVWQMIWLAFGSICFFVPLALIGTPLIYGSSDTTAMQRDYFRWMMMFGFSLPLYGALCGFFVGQGKVKIVTYLAISANFINAFLDWLFIFGWEGVIPSMGVKGAAIATCSSSIFQTGILMWIFLKKENRQHCGTGDFRLKWKVLWDCLRIGAPNAIVVTVEISAWACYYMMMTVTSHENITVAGICQSLIYLLFFVSDGVGKGTIALTGYFIGAKRIHKVPETLKSGVLLHVGFFVLILSVFFLQKDLIMSLFLTEGAEHAYAVPLTYSLVTVAFYMLFEGLRFLVGGALTGAGDTLFQMVAGTITIWVLLILPIYYLIVVMGYSVVLAQTITVIYSAILLSLYYFRYQTGKWKEVSITQQTG